MNRSNNQVLNCKIVLAVLFIICLADMPYGYFQLVRFIGMIGFVFLGIKANDNENKNWMIFYIVSAILINPIFKISLGREIWNLIDILWALTLIASVFLRKKNKLKKGFQHRVSNT